MSKPGVCEGLPWPLVDARWLASMRQRPDLVVLDATVELQAPRFDGDYHVASGYEGWKHEHIPGSRHADLVEDLSIEHPVCSFTCPPAEELARSFEYLGVSDTSTVVVYDRVEGFWAARLWWMLYGLGVDAVVLDGGWRAYREAELPGEQGEPLPSVRGRLYPRTQDGIWCDLDRVLAVVEEKTAATLICGLSGKMFAGDVPSRYARRGHIPGSLNLSARELLDPETGRYLPREELQSRVGAVIRDRTNPVILYCGGGISAAVDALVLTMLGHAQIAIYDGSLQEWAADPRLPMELGQVTEEVRE